MKDLQQRCKIYMKALYRKGSENFMKVFVKIKNIFSKGCLKKSLYVNSFAAPFLQRSGRAASWLHKNLFPLVQGLRQRLLVLKKRFQNRTIASLRGFGLRGLFLELSLLLAASLGITLSARLLLFSHLEASALLGQRDLLLSFALLQDFFSALLVLCGAFLIGLFSSSYPRLRLSLWSFYLFLVGLAYLINLKYYSLYAENFSWSHLKGGTVWNAELWYSSIWTELDREIALQLLALAFFCLLWFFISLKVIGRLSPFFFKSKLFFARQALLRLCLFSFSLLFLLGTANSSLAESSLSASSRKNYNAENYTERAQLLQSKHRLSNFLWQLSFPYESKGKEPLRANKAYHLLPLRDAYRFRPFQFGFDSSSKEIPGRRKPIPFLRKGNYNIVLYIFESTAYSYLKRKIKKDIGDKGDKGDKEEIPITPGWQRLSQNAIVFENHYVHNPLSANSLFSLLVSAYSMPADIWPVQEYPQIPLQSLPQILKKADYRNAFIHTGRLSYVGQDKFLANRGFDLVQDMRHLRVPPYEKALNWGIDDRALIAAARRFAVEASDANKPYFLVLSPLSPHHPYDVPEEKFRILKAPPAEKDPPTESESGIAALSTLEKNWKLPPKKQRKNSFIRYLNSLHYADSVLQELVHSLENLPGGEKTLFFILADHGEAFGQHKGNFNHPFYLYEENVHVPFIIYNRKLFKNSLSYKAVSRHIDILPTILDCLGLGGQTAPHAKAHEGLSLLSGAPFQMASFYTSWRNHLAGLRDGKWKYILNLRYGTEELYDLEKDPKEGRNLAENEKAVSERYRDYLAELHAYQRKYFETALKQPIDWWAKIDKSGL